MPYFSDRNLLLARLLDALLTLLGLPFDAGEGAREGTVCPHT